MSSWGKFVNFDHIFPTQSVLSITDTCSRLNDGGGDCLHPMHAKHLSTKLNTRIEYFLLESVCKTMVLNMYVNRLVKGNGNTTVKVRGPDTCEYWSI